MDFGYTYEEEEEHDDLKKKRKIRRKRTIGRAGARAIAAIVIALVSAFLAYTDTYRIYRF